MKVTHTATYDAPLPEVHAMLTDPAFREYAAARTGVLSTDVTVEAPGRPKLMAQLLVEGRDRAQAAGAAWLRGER